jgi:hypothetical protein
MHHRGAKTIKHLRRHGGFRLLEVDDLGDENCTPNMGNQEPHASARFLVGQAVALMAEHAVHCGAGRRFFQGGADDVDKPCGRAHSR